jgi:hypothetical protein
LDILKARLLDSRLGDSSMNRAFDDSAVNARHSHRARLTA